MSSADFAVPEFGRAVIEGDRTDGYWVETFKFEKDEVPGLVA